MESAIFDFYPSSSKPIGLVSIPHAGEVIPREFKKYLSGNKQAYARDVDFKTNELIDIQTLNDAGIHVIVSNIHRICIDLNRSSDLAVFAWPSNSHGEKLLKVEPTNEIKEKLLLKYYTPYYEVLKATIEQLEKDLGTSVPVIDFHSMPSSPTAYHLAITPDQDPLRPSFCLSNLKGRSCSEEFIQDFQASLENEYDNVALNFPYYGGYLTQYINTLNTQNFQVEVRRNIYMDEVSRVLTPEHLKVKELVSNCIVKLFKKFNRY